ncbi:hypothetical protein O181_027489 [Austropuccinia psidii MF-1]|uniref:Uncharacterized protein n=1 Tax=Austropuccinia psidii MF-1 TaxID=1389203 RepID=A0A9Q3CP45_9BASI|nr:hypothetical protein [Austropuccinia psidii MF-1]
MHKAIPNRNTLPNPSNTPKRVKGYIWSNDPINKAEEVIGDVEDPYSIFDKPRRKKYTANFSKLLHNDPKNYKQATSHEDSENGKKAIYQELRNMDKHKFGHLSPMKRNKSLNHYLGIQEKD